MKHKTECKTKINDYANIFLNIDKHNDNVTKSTVTIKYFSVGCQCAYYCIVAY